MGTSTMAGGSSCETLAKAPKASMAAASNAKTNAVALGALILEILVISRSLAACLPAFVSRLVPKFRSRPVFLCNLLINIKKIRLKPIGGWCQRNRLVEPEWSTAPVNWRITLGARRGGTPPTRRQTAGALRRWNYELELRVSANALVDHHVAVLVGGAEERFAAIRPHGDG